VLGAHARQNKCHPRSLDERRGYASDVEGLAKVLRHRRLKNRGGGGINGRIIARRRNSTRGASEDAPRSCWLYFPPQRCKSLSGTAVRLIGNFFFIFRAGRESRGAAAFNVNCASDLERRIYGFSFRTATCNIQLLDTHNFHLFSYFYVFV
jgi:hypothetical protein